MHELKEEKKTYEDDCGHLPSCTAKAAFSRLQFIHNQAMHREWKKNGKSQFQICHYITGYTM